MVAIKGLKKVASPPGKSPEHHAAAIFGSNGAISDHLCQDVVSARKKRFKPGHAIIVEGGEHNDQAAASTQFSLAQRQKELPVLSSLEFERLAHRARTRQRHKMVRNQHRNAAQPHSRVGGPSQVNMFFGKNALVE